jgi:methylated-DNA-protein-cysteine methyltransferase related protein
MLYVARIGKQFWSISMPLTDKGFRERVLTLVAQIPEGNVMTYGQIAAMCGNPRAARIVGGIAHFGDPSLPWQRVVKKDGSLAEGYPGGISGHESAIAIEGVKLTNGHIDMKRYQWWPNNL